MENLRFNDPKVRANPYPFYAKLRRDAPITEAYADFIGDVILVTRYEDVLTGLKHPHLSSDIKKTTMGGMYYRWWMPKVFQSLVNSMVLMDDPEHRRLRDLVHKAFTPKMIQQMSGLVEQITDTLLDTLTHKHQVDLLKDFALPIPLTVISEMMSVPEKDRSKFNRWSSDFMEVAGGEPLVMLRQFPNAFRMQRFFERLIRLHREETHNDLLTSLLHAEADGDRLNDDELIAMIFLLLLAGHETTVNLISTGVLSLLEFPDQLALLRENPDLIDSAIEELLRYSNPVEHGSMRIALEDVELGGETIPKDSVVLLLLSSANRDETVFTNPDKLDITRNPNRHLSFGFGIHYCLGAPLARLEGRIAIQKLIQRFPDMHLAIPHNQLEWRPTTAVRGLKKLPIRMR
jgi:cytochrome P450 PksS